jgi:DNA-binding NarL/FixJ family response regulator
MALDDATSKSHEPVIVAVEEVLQAIRAVQRALRESEARTEENLTRLRRAEQLADVVRQAPVSMARIDINDAIDRLTTARQASRAACFRQLIEEGMTRKEIASRWGFSQQVVSRIVNHEDPPAATGR